MLIWLRRLHTGDSTLNFHCPLIIVISRQNSIWLEQTSCTRTRVVMSATQKTMIWFEITLSASKWNVVSHPQKFVRSTTLSRRNSDNAAFKCLIAWQPKYFVDRRFTYKFIVCGHNWIGNGKDEWESESILFSNQFISSVFFLQFSKFLLEIDFSLFLKIKLKYFLCFFSSSFCWKTGKWNELWTTEYQCFLGLSFFRNFNLN